MGAGLKSTSIGGVDKQGKDSNRLHYYPTVACIQ